MNILFRNCAMTLQIISEISSPFERACVYAKDFDYSFFHIVQFRNSREQENGECKTD